MKTPLSMLAIEAIVVGICTAIVGSLVGYAVSDYYRSTTGKSWGVQPMLVSLFLTGAGIHVGFEALGLNAYYVQSKLKA